MYKVIYFYNDQKRCIVLDSLYSAMVLAEGMNGIVLHGERA